MTVRVAPIPKLTLPGDVGQWMTASDVDSCKAVFQDRSKDGPPSVTLVRQAEPELRIMKAWAERMADGLHFYVTASPNEQASVMHLALRNKPVRESKMSATAAIMAPLALHFHRHESHIPLGAQADWMKKAHSQILRAVTKDGAEALTGVSPVFVLLSKECMRLIDRVLGKDLEESLARVRKEFEFLLDHVEEETVLRIWREAGVTKVHER